MSEYIGSRISLISKSDIKYIGTLHEINSDSHTVALESVTSYGTEGRKGNPTEEIPGSDQVYEYIVFRGSDVKELTIVAAPGESEKQKVPDDPAILGVS
jgi:protein LSM14